MMRRLAYIVLVLILSQIVTAFLFNDTLLEDNDINLNGIKTRRRKEKSTSSDSNSVGGTAGDASESLNVVFTESSSEDSDGKNKPRKKKKKDREPKSSAERKGWRKWHRKCTKCPEDMQKKWRNPSISWICGAYQRARRSFKSLCMMYYRNCQDGTMFTKIADHRCPNGTREGVHPYNFHFFYDYSVALTSESESSVESLSESDTKSSDIRDTELEKNLPKFYFNGPN